MVAIPRKSRTKMKTKKMDPSGFRLTYGRKNIANILQGLGFKDTPRSRKLDPWMIAVLALQGQREIMAGQEVPDEIGAKKEPILKKGKVGFLYKPIPTAPPLKKFPAGKLWHKLSKKTAVAIPVARKELPLAIGNKIIEEMGGSDLEFLIEKRVTNTDVGQQQNRFFLPMRQVKHEFLTEEEKAKLYKAEAVKIKLLIFNEEYQPDLEESRVHEIDLKIWEMTSCKVYVLNGDGRWNPLVREYKLEAGMLVQVWAFRVQSQLSLALIKLQDPQSDH